jgi:hypothetical protein
MGKTRTSSSLSFASSELPVTIAPVDRSASHFGGVEGGVDTLIPGGVEGRTARSGLTESVHCFNDERSKAYVQCIDRKRFDEA